MFSRFAFAAAFISLTTLSAALAQTPATPSARPLPSSSRTAIDPPTFRLSDAVTPIGYGAHLIIDPNRDSFDGEVVIDLRLNAPQDTIWLNATQLTVQSATLEMQGKRWPLDVTINGEDFAGFTGAATFPSGEARLTIRYRGRLEPLATQGLFRQREGADWYAITQFEAIHARRALPCFDEPQWKVPWQLTLDVPAGMVAASNTPQVAETPIEGGMKRIEFARTKPLPSYLIAMAVGPFDVVDGGLAGQNRFPLRYLAPRGRGGEMRYAKEITPRLIELLEAYFGTPYPFEKLDSVSIPQTVNFGAMENAGLITYTSRLLLAKPYEETPAFKRRYAGVGAHELAHQWFGNLVTMKWWDDTWLNEAFATWMAGKITRGFEPGWDDGHSRAQSRRYAVASDRLAATRRVRNPVDVKGDVWAAFDSITYQKGGQVLAMFEQSLGEERFREGVRRYLARHARGNASSEDFMAALAEVAGPGSELAADFRGFIEQPGVPLVGAALDCQSKPTLKLTQERLRPVGSTADTVPRWTTPVCFRYAVKNRLYTACGNLVNGATTLALTEAARCPDWVLGNAGGIGYYVTRYDDDLRMRLGRSALQLPIAEAVALLGDTGLLVESGLQSAEGALALAERHAAHASPVVRQAVVELVKTLRPDWLSTAERARTHKLLVTQLLPQARKLGWLEKADDSDRVKALRNELLPLAADRGGDLVLRREAARLAERWMAQRDAVPASVVEAVLNTAAAFSDEASFSRMERAVFTVVDRADRARLLHALALTRDPALRERAYALALDTRIDGREALGLLDAALESDASRRFAFAYLREHFDGISARIPTDTQVNLMRVLGRACTADERDAFTVFFGERNAKYLGGPRAYRQSLERIDLCVAARAAAGPAQEGARTSAAR